MVVAAGTQAPLRGRLAWLHDGGPRGYMLTWLCRHVNKRLALLSCLAGCVAGPRRLLPEPAQAADR